MKYNYNTNEPVLTVLSIEAENIDDAINKIRKKMIWELAKLKDFAIEIYFGDRTKLSFDDLKNKDLYRIIYPKLVK